MPQICSGFALNEQKLQFSRTIIYSRVITQSFPRKAFFIWLEQDSQIWRHVWRQLGDSTRSPLQQHCLREIHEHANNIPARDHGLFPEQTLLPCSSARTKKPSCITPARSLMFCMKASSRRSRVRETVKLPEVGCSERHQASRVWEQGKKAKPKATLDPASSEQPSIIEDLEHERVT
ncbi:Hypothetical_protein [Hexamita inflata]|uniref:Hypothetical_protein n=1 Tax=Hexamita inflata TaxID=28002 RepID=A0ABP1H4J0_9EUKA